MSLPELLASKYAQALIESGYADPRISLKVTGHSVWKDDTCDLCKLHFPKVHFLRGDFVEYRDDDEVRGTFSVKLCEDYDACRFRRAVHT